MTFNVGLFLVMAYTMLEAGNAITIGFLLDTVAGLQGHSGLNQQPFIVLSIMFLAWLNYRGVLATLTFNLVITAIAFLAIIALFLVVQLGGSAVQLDFSAVTTDPMPYGWVGIIAALHFGLWFYLGIEGTCQAAEEVRSPARSLPYGTMAGIMTLLIAATMTWYVCSGLIPWEYLGQAGTPLFDAARVTGNTGLMVLLFVGTLFSTLASANGCINDASRAWFSMGRDHQQTSFDEALKGIEGEIKGNIGMGTSNADRQKIVFFVADGVGDSYKPAGCTSPKGANGGRCIEPIDTAYCKKLKDRGIKVAVLYTTYLPLPDNSFYNDWVKPFESKIATKMEECATPGFYFAVSPTDGIEEAMEALFLKIVSAPRITS